MCTLLTEGSATHDERGSHAAPTTSHTHPVVVPASLFRLRVVPLVGSVLDSLRSYRPAQLAVLRQLILSARGTRDRRSMALAASVAQRHAVEPSEALHAEAVGAESRGRAQTMPASIGIPQFLQEWHVDGGLVITRCFEHGRNRIVVQPTTWHDTPAADTVGVQPPPSGFELVNELTRTPRNARVLSGVISSMWQQISLDSTGFVPTEVAQHGHARADATIRLHHGGEAKEYALDGRMVVQQRGRTVWTSVRLKPLPPSGRPRARTADAEWCGGATASEKPCAALPQETMPSPPREHARQGEARAAAPRAAGPCSMLARFPNGDGDADADADTRSATSLIPALAAGIPWETFCDTACVTDEALGRMIDDGELDDIIAGEAVRSATA